MKNIKALMKWKNATTALFILTCMLIVVSPRAKVLMIAGMMKIGLMRAPTETVQINGSTDPGTLLLRSADGNLINTSGQKGKVLILNFWATWCPPCIAEMPTINGMYLHYKNNPAVFVIPVDVDGDFKKSVAFMQKNKYSLPVYNIGSSLPDNLLSSAIPTTVIIDKKGKIVARHEGAADYSSPAFYAYIDKLLATR